MNARDGFPNAALALSLAAAATFFSFFAPALAGGTVAAAAVCAVLGLGALGFLAARRVPEPAGVRLGLAPFPIRALLPVLLLLPAVLVVSEIDNWIRIAFAAKTTPGLGKPAFPAADAALFAILLKPVLNEFFFRGVLLQGSIPSLGRWRAIFYVSALEIVLYPGVLLILALAPEPNAPYADLVSQAAATVCFGALCGLLRVATSSLLPGIAFAALATAIGFAAGAFPDLVGVPGFNLPGGVTPLGVLVPAALSTAAGIWLLARQQEREPALPPIPPRQEDDEERGSLF